MNEAAILRARRFTKLGRYEEAVRVLTSAESGGGNSLEAHVGLAEVERARQNWPAVAKHLNDALSTPEGARNAGLAKRLAFALRKLKKGDESDSVLRNSGLVDSRLHARYFEIDGEPIAIEVYPVLVESESVQFLDHSSDRDVLLVKSRNAIFLSRDGSLSWQRLALKNVSGVTAGFLVDEAHLLLYDSRRQALDLYDATGNHLASHDAVHPWHGSWGIARAGDTIIYAEYDVHQKHARKADSGQRRVYRSSDHGRTWEKVFEQCSSIGPGQEIRHFHTVQPDPYQPNTWYLSSGDVPGQCHVWCSQDNGSSWEKVSGASDGIHPNTYRFTAVQFLEDAIYWGTDDLLGSEHAYAVRALRSRPLKVELLGPIGCDKFRALVATDFGLLAISQAKEANPGPQVYLSLIARRARVLNLDPIACSRANSATVSCASRTAVNGRFFTRGMRDSFGNRTETYLWKINYRNLLDAADRCNLCSDDLQAALANDMERSVRQASNTKLWRALNTNKNEAFCPTCFSRARMRIFAAVFGRIARDRAGAALTVSASRQEYAFISKVFSPVTNVTLYGAERYPNAIGGIDIAAMPQIPSSAFAFSHAMCVLDYIPNLAGVFREMWRVLKPGGSFLFLIQPWRLEEGEHPPRVLHHNAMSVYEKYDRGSSGQTGIPHCIFSLGWIRNELRASGFKVDVMDLQDPFSDIRNKWLLCTKPVEH